MKLSDVYNRKFGITLEEALNVRIMNYGQIFACCTVRGRRFSFSKEQFVQKTFDNHEIGGYKLTCSCSGPKRFTQIKQKTLIGGTVSKKELVNFMRESLLPWFTKQIVREDYFYIPFFS